MSKEALSQRVLTNPQIDIYECGRQDIRAGQIDRRVLATLEFLAASGLRPTVTALKCGHSYLTTSGNVSEHSTGTAVDIGAINGITITPSTQGKGSITEMTIQRLLTLQGTMKPHQIISLMQFAGTDNTFAMGDHDDHIHVGFRPFYGANSKAARQVNAILKPKQWIKLIDRLGEIDNPTVRRTPSKYRRADPLVGRAQGRIAALARFGFVQWEFPAGSGPSRGATSPAASPAMTRGRCSSSAGSRPRGGAGAARAPRKADPAPVAVEVTRATVIDA